MRKSSPVRRFKRYQRYRTKTPPVERELGIKLRSGFERTLAAQMKRANVPFEYEPVKLPYVLERHYIPDFKIGDMYIEAKGKLDQETRTKMLAVKRAYPELNLRIVFMRADNKLSKGSKQTYAQWAEKNGFIWADGVIPEEWFNE